MPKTKLQNFIFTSMMAFLMVYAMICYNIAIATGGMTNQVFIMAFQEMIVMWPIAIILELFVVEKIVQSLTFGWQIFFAGPLIRKIFRQIFVNE